jgi:hypothetical protein
MKSHYIVPVFDCPECGHELYQHSYYGVCDGGGDEEQCPCELRDVEVAYWGGKNGK